MKKKLIILILIAFIFVGCRKPIITLIDQEPPSGYSKVFLLEDNYFTSQVIWKILLINLKMVMI